MNSIETGKIEGDVSITKDFQLNGMITGSVTVETGAHFLLHGTVNKDVIVSNGASAQINGIVNGNVINQGGVVKIQGVVHGTVQGEVKISPNAVIG